MQALTEKALELSPPMGIFDVTVVHNFFPHRTESARKAMVHRAVSSGEVSRIRPGLYCLANRYRKTHPHPFAVAGLLLSPSHVSMESALWHHGLIPEGIRQVASATPARTRSFQTPLGNFTYLSVPANNPRAGARAVQVDAGIWAFVATPLRAIADLVYSRRAVRWEKDGLGFLTDSLRIEMDDLETMPFDDAQEVSSSIRNERTTHYIAGMLRALGR